MPTPTQQHAARRLQLLSDYGLPQPDTTEYTDSEIRLLWADRKVAVIVELADLDADGQQGPAASMGGE